MESLTDQEKLNNDIKVLCRSQARLSQAQELAFKLNTEVIFSDIIGQGLAVGQVPALVMDENEIFLMNCEAGMHCDLTDMLSRLNEHNLNRELLIRATGYKAGRNTGNVTVADATAGLGEDSVLLAGAGFNVIMFEKDPVIAALLRDSMLRAGRDGRMKDIIGRMKLVEGSSIDFFDNISKAEKFCFTDHNDIIRKNDNYNRSVRPDIIYLDPMFPERSKSALVKKKFQLLHYLEKPCDNEEELLTAAIKAGPDKVIIKRPLKGPVLAGIKPSYSIKGKTIRYDCIVLKTGTNC